MMTFCFAFTESWINVPENTVQPAISIRIIVYINRPAGPFRLQHSYIQHSYIHHSDIHHSDI